MLFQVFPLKKINVINTDDFLNTLYIACYCIFCELTEVSAFSVRLDYGVVDV